jgi:hypothetical protein
MDSQYKLYFIVDNEVLRAPYKMPDGSVCNEDFLEGCFIDLVMELSLDSRQYGSINYDGSLDSMYDKIELNHRDYVYPDLLEYAEGNEELAEEELKESIESAFHEAVLFDLTQFIETYNKSAEKATVPNHSQPLHIGNKKFYIVKALENSTDSEILDLIT